MRRYSFQRKSRLFLVGAIDAVGDLSKRLIRWASCAKGPPSWEELKTADFAKILVIRLDHAGDVLLALPAIQALRRRFPQAMISMLVGPWAREILEKNRDLDEIITFDAFWFARGKGRWSVLKQLLPLVRRIRREGFDLGLEFRGDLRHNLLMWLGDVRVRVGYGVAGGGFLLTHELPHLPGRHEVEYNLGLVRALGWDGEVYGVKFAVDEEEAAFARSLLSSFGIERSRPLVAIHPGAGLPWKRWAIDRFAAIAGWAGRELGATVVVLGGQDEVPLSQFIAAACPGRSVDLAGRTTLRQLAAVFQLCRIFVGNDSAPAHLAAAVGTPAVVIFSCVHDPVRWRPLGERVTVLFHPEACGPREKRFCADQRCLDAISIEEVKSAILRQW